MHEHPGWYSRAQLFSTRREMISRKGERMAERNVDVIAKEILELADRLAVEDKRVKAMQKTGKSKEDPTLWIRRDIGELVKEYMAYAEMRGYQGSGALDALAAKLGGRFGANTLRGHANYSYLSKEDIEDHVKQGLSWRNAVLQAKGAIAKTRKKQKKMGPSDLDLGG